MSYFCIEYEQLNTLYKTRIQKKRAENDIDRTKYRKVFACTASIMCVYEKWA